MEYTAKLGFEVGGFEVGNEKEHVLTPADYAGCMKTMSVVFFLLFSFYFPNFLLLARALSCTLRSCYYFDVCEDHVRGLSPSLFPYFGPCTFTLSILPLLRYPLGRTLVAYGLPGILFFCWLAHRHAHPCPHAFKWYSLVVGNHHQTPSRGTLAKFSGLQAVQHRPDLARPEDPSTAHRVR